MDEIKSKNMGSSVQQVVSMSNRLAVAVRDAILCEFPSLSYWSIDRTPHNPGAEGFICDIHKVGLPFLRD